MDEMEKNQQRMKHLSKAISEKIETVAKLRNDLENKKKTTGNSVDEQIVIAEMEYRLVKEEMALLSCQEQHWESAALWDIPPPPPAPTITPRKEEMWEVLQSYIVSLKERGAVPTLHASEHLQLENSILVSCQREGSTIPKVEWAHQATELQSGDRLVEVNGHLVIGKDSSEVGQILMSSRHVCRVVYLRPLSLYQMIKNNGGCKETSNLRQELTTVVTRLNHKMMESANLTEKNLKLQKENDDLKMQTRKLKLQLVSLQSILLYMLQVMEKDPGLATLPSPLSVFDLLRNGPSGVPDEGGLVCLLPRLNKRMVVPSLQMNPKEEQEQHNNSLDLSINESS